MAAFCPDVFALARIIRRGTPPLQSLGEGRLLASASAVSCLCSPASRARATMAGHVRVIHILRTSLSCLRDSQQAMRELCNQGGQPCICWLPQVTHRRITRFRFTIKHTRQTHDRARCASRALICIVAYATAVLAEVGCRKWDVLHCYQIHGFTPKGTRCAMETFQPTSDFSSSFEWMQSAQTELVLLIPRHRAKPARDQRVPQVSGLSSTNSGR